MIFATAFALLLLCGFATAHRRYHGRHILGRRTATPDNTCGGVNGYICDPSRMGGFGCCSAEGFCGNTAYYCGTGCQPAFGTCGSSSSAPIPSSSLPPASSPLPLVSPSASSPPASSLALPPSGNYLPPPSSGGGPAVPAQAGCVWAIHGVGSFTHQGIFDFSQATRLPGGLKISTDSIAIGTEPFSQLYTTANVAVTGGTLQLKVPGGQSASPILGAQIITTDQDILYGSVRTTMEVSSVAGTVHGAFFYKNDNQESDIEILTAALGQGAHYSNQNLVPGGKSTSNTQPLPPDAITTMHEYRLDWLESRTDFYLDGVLQQSFTDNVPNTAGSWLWNNWSNGDHLWSAGPPAQDSIMKIGKIEMYYNRTGSMGSCT